MSGMAFDANYAYSRYLAQVAAESYLKVKGADGEPELLGGDLLNKALKLGANRKDFGLGSNGHTQLTDSQVQEFLSTYQLIDQWADNPTPIGTAFTAPLTLADGTVVPSNTGFSATLMAITGKPGEYVFAIRSTEFKDWVGGGDGPRDKVGSDVAGITFGGGYAWAQIDAMRYYVQWLREQNLLPAGAQVHVTGYSLGGQLALAFEKLYGAGQGGFSLVDGTTFNGAGLGTSDGTSIAAMGDFYRAQIASPSYFSAALPTSPLDADAAIGFALYTSALAAAENPVDQVNIFSDNRNAWAQWATSRAFHTKWISNGTGLPTTDPSPGYGSSVVTGLYGNEVSGNFDMTATSGLHPATVGVPVETQPLLEGSDPLGADGDFGNGHSITLLGDSLALMRTLQKLDPTISIEAYTQMARWASDKSSSGWAHGVRANGDLDSGYEYDVLENILDSLRKMFEGDGIVNTMTVPGYKPVNQAFSDPAARADFYKNIADLIALSQFSALANRIKFVTPQSGPDNLSKWTDFINTQRNDFSAFLTLYTLSPFQLQGVDAASEASLEAALKVNWSDVYQKWKDDQSLAPSERTFSDQWLQDRQQMLFATLKANEPNVDTLQNPVAGVDAGYLSDLKTNRNVTIVLSSSKSIQFGDENDNTLSSSTSTSTRKNGHLFGGAGNDTLIGADLADYLEGGEGSDKLSGGGQRDTLIGGAGNDTLQGGNAADLLYGGSGDDQLNGDSGDDLLFGGSGADTLNGGADNDYLFDEGGSDTNTLRGDEGNDVLEVRGGTGDATLEGGADNDILIGGQGKNFLDGGSGNDSIQGGGGNDTVRAGDGADIVNAGGGDDNIIGGKGADYLLGGSGDDTYYFETDDFGVDLLEDGQGTDKIRVTGSELGPANYDADKMAWVAESGMEIRKYDFGGSTMLALSKPGDKLNTIYIQDWQPGQYGITLSGEPQTPERPSVATPALPTRPENNDVDLAYTDAADGGAGNDILRGSSNNSVLLGGIGNDLIEGRGGDDWLEGGDGTDLIATGEGKDVALGGAGNDILRAGVVLDLAKGVSTGTGAPVLFWTQTNPGFLVDDDTTREFTFTVDGQRRSVAHPELAVFDLSFAAELDVSSNLTSHLWWYDSDSATASLEPSLNISVTLGDPEFVQRGENYSQAPSSNFGKGKTYTLLLQGDGLLMPGTNVEGARLYGGTGDDVIYGANNNDKLYGEDDNDLLVGYDGDDELYGGKGKDELSGGAGRDYLDGGDQDDLLVGGYGADVLVGGDGNDKLVGDATLLAGTKDYPPGMDKSLMGGDYLQGGAGNDSLWGNDGDDYLFGGANDDLIYGGEGDDHAFGEDGVDVLSGGNGGDYLDGGANNDTVYGDDGGDFLLGGSGNDYLDGGEGDDILDGGADNDTLYGGSGQDNLRGGTGNDTLFGDGGETTEGADILEGGAGNDELFGGGKGDMYVFSKGDGQDTVNDDGADGSRNVIVFKFASNEVRELKKVGNDLLIKYGVDDQVTVKGYYGGSGFSLGSAGAGDGGDEEGEAQPAIAEIRFEDGTVWGTEEILAMAPLPPVVEPPSDPYAGLSSIYFVNALLSREQTKAAGKHSLSFSFANSFVPGVTGFYEFDEAQKQAVRDALSRFSAVLNLSFTELADGAQADLTFHLDDLTSGGMGGDAGYAEPATGDIHLNSSIYSERRLTETGEQVTRGSLSQGQPGFEVLLHEIGHSLGLKHPFEPPVLPYAENSTANTVMSYTASGSPATSLAAFDVAALQYLYGVAAGINAGNDTHTFSERWIQDSGGTDIFTAAGDTVAVNVNLTPGSWIYRGGKADSILASNQAFIGFGSQIENATGGNGNDTLTGSSGNNVLRGNAGDDILSGGGGDDSLSGGDGDDTLAGDEGNDMLQGSLGSDTYVWGAGWGNDVISETNSSTTDVDTLHIVSGLQPGDLLLTRSGNDLVVQARASHETLTVRNHYTGSGIERIVFDDNTQWDAATILANVNNDLTDGDDYFVGTAAAEIVDGHGGNDTIFGGGGNDHISGGAGNDSLNGNDGDDVLTGGTGNDFFWSSKGNDTYVFGRGDGADTLDYGLLPDSTTIQLQPGIAAADLVMSSDVAFGRDVKFTIAGTTDSFTIKNFLTWSSGDDYINQLRVEFADGTAWSGMQTLQHLYGGTQGNDHLIARDSGSSISGGAGNDTLEGGLGNDTLDGGEGYDSLYGGAGDDTLINGETMDGGDGDDTYVVGSGAAVIRDSGGSDVVLLPAGATPTNVQVFNGTDYGLHLKGEVNVQIDGYFKDTPGSRVEQIKFQDGTIWTLSDIVSRANINNMTEGDDQYQFNGFGWDDNIDAKGGNDYVDGLAGNDTIDGGTGNDTLFGDVGNDTLLGGAGDDSLYGDDFYASVTGNDRLDGGAGNDTLYGGKGDDVYVFGRQSDYDIVNDDGGNDRILLDAGIAPANVSLYNDSDDLVVVLDGSRVQMRVTSQFNSAASGKRVESIVFADGTVWDETYIASHVVAAGAINTFTGTSGNDSFVVDNTSDRIIEGVNQGTDSVTASTSYGLPDNVENLTLTGILNLWGRGNSLTNLIVGNAGDNLLSSDRGMDTLKGGAGNDYYDITIGSFAQGGYPSDVTVVENPGEGIDTVRVDNYDYTLPANVENLIAVSTWLTKYSGNNVVIPRYLTGNEANNLIDASMELYTTVRLDGGAGADTLVGSIKDNIYVVDNAQDVLIEKPNGGIDTVEASIDWTLAPNFENLTLAAGAGAIRGTGNAANNVLDGSDNSAANVLTGGLGDDTYVLGARDTTVEGVDGGNDTVLLRTGVVGAYRVADFANIENLSLGSEMGASTLLGSADNNSLVGNGRGNVIDGGAGDDFLADQVSARYPEEAADTLIGGDGADTLTSRAGADWLEGGHGNDTYVVNSYNASSGSAAWATVRFQKGDGADVLTGSRGTWISVGGWSLWDLNLRAQGSGYVLSFGDGTDSVAVQSPNQSVRLAFDDGMTLDEAGISALLNNPSGQGSAGADFLLGTNDADALNGLAGDDTIYGSGGDDSINGGDGSNLLYGGDGNDVIDVSEAAASYSNQVFGGLGNDTIFGGASSDVLSGDDGADEIHGGLGDDSLTGGAGDDVLLGDAGADTLLGGDGNDFLSGAQGDDSLRGGYGNDTLQGGTGNDYLDGDWGADVYQFGRGDGADTISGTYYDASPDELQLAAGITPDEVTVSRYGSGLDMLLSINGTTDSVRVVGFLNQTTPLGQIRFADGTVWTHDALLQQLSVIRGTTGADSLTGGAGPDKLLGLEGNDTLVGGAGADTLDGGAGIDRMLGGADNDTYIVDSTSDVIVENLNEGSQDSVLSTATYTLPSNVEFLHLMGTGNINGTGNSLNNWLEGNSGNNVLSGGAGADEIYGGDGSDTLDGGTGDDYMWGGLGDDSYTVDSAPVWNGGEQIAGDIVDEGVGEGIDSVSASVSYTLPDNVENLTLTGSSKLTGTGNALANVLTGNSAANLLVGGDGNDTISGGAGADTMVGGAGDDSYVVDATGDVITEAAGEGLDSVSSSVTYTLGANVENLILTGTSAINGTGNASNNVLTGNSGANKLTGGAGNDVLDGGAGSDTMIGGTGDDVYLVNVTTDVVTEAAGEGTDTIMSSVSLTTLAINVENLTLTGTANLNGAGNALDNVLTGNAGANNLNGGAGNDTLDGGAGSDTLVGGAGHDTFIVDVSTDVITENANEGTDTVRSSVTWTLGTNLENLTLTGVSNINGTGNAADNVLTGNAGNNMLIGAAGADTLDGKAGNDTLNGGAGADTYWFGKGYGADLITDNDSTAGVKDVVRFDASIAQSDIRFTQSGNALVATIMSTSETLTIQDWYLGTQYRVEEFRFNDGSVLTSAQAQALVGAMASFSGSGSGMTSAATSDQSMSRNGIAVSGIAAVLHGPVQHTSM